MAGEHGASPKAAHCEQAAPHDSWEEWVWQMKVGCEELIWRRASRGSRCGGLGSVGAQRQRCRDGRVETAREGRQPTKHQLFEMHPSDRPDAVQRPWRSAGCLTLTGCRFSHRSGYASALIRPSFLQSCCICCRLPSPATPWVMALARSPCGSCRLATTSTTWDQFRW